MVGAKPIIKAPKVKNKSAMMTVGFLPNLSAMGPTTKDPNAAPRVARDTIN